MLPVTKCPMGPDLHISKMAAIHTTKMLIAITHYQSADFYNFGAKIWFSDMLNSFQGFKNSLVIWKGPKHLDGHQSRLKIMHDSLSSDMQLLILPWVR